MKKIIQLASVMFLPLPLFAQWGPISADVIVTGANNFGTTLGATITTAIGNAGTVGGTGTTVGTNTNFGGGPTGGGTPQSITVGANQGVCSNLGAVQLTGSTLYPAQSLNNAAVAFSDTTSNKSWSVNFTGTPGNSKQSWFLVCVQLGFPYVNNGNDTDLLGLWDANGDYYELQMNFACNQGGQMGLRGEQKNGGTAHTPNCIMITPQNTNDHLAGTYWLAGLRDSNTGWYTIYVYTATGTYVGQTSSIGQADGAGLTFIQAGNNEGNSSAGTTTYFQNMMIGWSSTTNQMVTGTSATFTNGSAAVTGLTGCTVPPLTAIMTPDTGLLGGTGDYYWVVSCTSSTTANIAGQHCTTSGCSALTGYNGTTTTGSWELMPSPMWQNTSLAAGVVAPGRSTQWAPGVQGGIPTNRTQCTTTACNTVVSGPANSITSTQINSAISSAPANTYVFLPAGTYSAATGPISATTSNVTLRGAGANQTFLAPTSASHSGSIFMGSTANTAASPQNGPVAVTGSVIQGSSLVTLASVPNLKVGGMMIFDQLDPTCDSGGIFVNGTGSSYTCTGTSPGTNGPYNTIGGGNGIRGGSGCSSSPNGCYHQQQIVQVTSCNGDTTIGDACTGTGVSVGFAPALHMPNWNTTNMFAWWITNTPQGIGIEDLSIDSTNNPGANSIEVNNCMGCWVKGVRSTGSSAGHVQLLYDLWFQLENSYLFLTQNTATTSYGFEIQSASDSLVENNIFQGVATPMIINGSGSANVFGYNFCVNEFFTNAANYSIPAYGQHGAGTDMTLVEGNICNGATGDVIHGSGNLESLLRNVEIVQPACWQSGGSYSSAVYGSCQNGITVNQIYAYHRFYNLVGNVVGISGTTTTYCNGGSSCKSAFTANNTNAFGIGYGNGSVGNDSNTVNTISLWGNSDPVTHFASPRFNCSEIATFPPAGTAESSIIGTQYNYLNPCPVAQTLPASFYYASTPSWWPSGKPWPAIGPDVTSGNVGITSGTAFSHAPTIATSSSQVGGATLGTYANGEVNSIPAMDCALNIMGISPDGTSAEAPFNEATCYSGNIVPTQSTGQGITLNGATLE